MDEIFVQAGATADAAAEGRQAFVGGGPDSLVQLNGNPADYVLEHRRCADSDAIDRYVLIALNGTGEYHIEKSVERVRFISGACSFDCIGRRR